MAKRCKTKISIHKQQTIMTNVCSWMLTEVSPQTIVWYVSDYLDIPVDSDQPPVTATNWCLLSCISSCLFMGSTFFDITGVEYTDIPETLYCITSCFPLRGGKDEGEETTATPAPCANSGLPSPEIMAGMKAAQLANIVAEADSAIAILLEEVARAIELIGIIIASFVVWMAIFNIQAVTTVIGRTLQIFGKAAMVTAQTMETAAKLAESAAIGAVASATATDDGHPATIIAGANTEHAVSTFLASVAELFHNVVGTISDAIGDITTSTGIIVFDFAQVGYAVISQAINIAQISSFIEEKMARIKEIEDGVAAASEQIAGLYDKKIQTMTDMIEIDTEQIVLTEPTEGWDGSMQDIILQDV